MSARPPIVVSGLGLVSALGLSRRETWERIRSGECGIKPLSAIESALDAGRCGGEAPAFEGVQLREVAYLRLAIDEALREAGLTSSAMKSGRDARAPRGFPYDAARCGAIFGTTLGGMRAGGVFLRTGDPAHLRSFLAGATLRAAIEDLPIEGWTLTTCAACASGLVSVAIARDLLESGTHDLVIAGGYDTLSEYAYGGFDSLRLVASGPPRPFASDRDGMSLGEGFAVLVMERADSALARGATPLAFVAGCGETSDAHHLTQPHPDGEGAADAITIALRDAGLTQEDVDLISAHATATPSNDGAEHAALARVFGPRLADVSAVAFKSHLGHTLGGAGAVELALAITALEEQTVPPTANVRPESLEFDDVGLVTAAKARPLTTSINLSLGFGGTNAAVVARAPAAGFASAPAPGLHEAVITGVGCVLPRMIGNEAFVRALDGAPPRAHAAEPLDDKEISPFIDARRVRRMSAYVKLMLSATTIALRDAGVGDDPAFARSCSVVLGSAHGAVQYTVDYYREIVESGINHANPMLFAEAVPNVGSAQLSLMLGLRGASQTIIGTRSAGLDALALAAMRVRQGKVDRVIVGAAEERHQVIDDAYRACGLLANGANGARGGPFGDASGFVTGWGAVVIVVESRAAAEERGARILGSITSTAAAQARDERCSDRTALVADLLRQVRAPAAPAAVVGSANGTWIDRVEQDGFERAIGAAHGLDAAPALAHSAAPALALSHIYGHIAETFAVMPLASIAAVLLRRRLPASNPAASGPGGLASATRGAHVESFCVLCSDYSGGIRAVSLRCEDV